MSAGSKGNPWRPAGLLLVACPLAAAPLRYLARDELLCEPARLTCIRATLTWEQNDRVLRLRGRVAWASGPGLFSITFIGTTRQGDTRYSPMEVRIRGRASEIVNHKTIPDYPEVYDWVVDRIEFAPGAPDASSRSGVAP